MGMEEFVDVEARLESTVDQLAKEFEGLFERRHIEALVSESARGLRESAVSSFVPVLAHRFARERLRAQAQAEGKLAKSAVEVVFVSISGGGRARMAASLLQQRTGDEVSVHSAGTGSVAAIDGNVQRAMEELGIDLSDKYARPLTPEVLASADVVVTLGRSVGHIEIPKSAQHVDWRVGDPAGAELEEVRRVRDDIERRVDQLIDELPVLAGAGASPTDAA